MPRRPLIVPGEQRDVSTGVDKLSPPAAHTGIMPRIQGFVP